MANCATAATSDADAHSDPPRQADRLATSSTGGCESNTTLQSSVGAASPYFLIGAHAQASLLQALLALPVEPTLLPARIVGHRASVLFDAYKVILPPSSTDGSAVVDGAAFYPSTSEQVRTLEQMAQGALVMHSMSMTIWAGWRKKTVMGRGLVYMGGLDMLRLEISAWRDDEEKRRKDVARTREKECVVIKKCRRRVFERVWEWLVEVRDGGDGREGNWDWKEVGIGGYDYL